MLAVVLAWAGVSKIRHPEPTRRALVALGAPATAGLTLVLAAAELGIAVSALVVPVGVSGVLLAGFFACLALAAGLLARKGHDSGCGWIGEGQAPPPCCAHVGGNAVAALAAERCHFEQRGAWPAWCVPSPAPSAA